MTRRIALAGVAIASLSLAGSAQQQPFRGGVDVVTLDVSVLLGNRPVAGLKSSDFLVTDNGVRQTVDAVLADTQPLDLTLAVDTSGSIDTMKDEVKTELRSAFGLLRPQDRFRLVVFSWVARDVAGLQPPSADLPLDGLFTGGNTSLHDALAATLIRVRPAGRGEIAVLFTDGVDNTSSVSLPMLKELARRSDVPLFLFIVRSGVDVMRDAALRGLERPDYAPLADLAETTGGRLESLMADNHIVAGLTRVLDDYRQRYTLRYTLSGVARPGWHDLVVKIGKPGEFAVSARKGYFGG